ncbi:MAG TPA: terminase TerL endonuclease subunit [Reyranella sp.]|nr:terminase TerL endonuclease subunit [Reyranella sp.]
MAAARRSPRDQQLDEVTSWARAVIAGDIVACRYVRLACERHLRDLVHGPARGLRWDAAAARHRIAFYPRFLRHSKGEWGGKPVHLSPWQKFSIGSVFGWKRADGTRRFRYVFEEVPRKNGKSTKLAGVGLDMLVCDGEPGGEVYAAATKREQARIIFDEAKRMVAASPALRAAVTRFKLNLSVEHTSSKFEPLSSDSRTSDGLNPHCVLIDELHKHRSRALLDVLDTALGSRRQPLLWIITTAGDDDPESVYSQENDYAIKVLEGTVEDDDFFAFIATIDKGDKWDDPQAWAKANPNIGISVKLDDLERQARKAAKSPTALAAFKRLRLNVRSPMTERAIDMELWAENSRGPFDADKLGKLRCWGGLDISSKIDISAWVKLYEPDESGIFRTACRFWMPADTLEERAERDRLPYREWVEEGWIEVTAGNVIDHGVIRDAILADAKRVDLQSAGYDPWNATQLAVECQSHGINMVEFIQGSRSYSGPTKELQALLLGRRIDHGDNPVLRVMASNLKVQRDKNLNEMPHKAQSTGRIDGMCALIMALGRYIESQSEPSPTIHII